MKVANRVLAATAMAGLLAAVPVTLRAQQESPNADNTKMNRRDRSKAEPTADQGKNNATDRELMQQIRKSVMDDKSLSSNAHNVKIIAQGGKVTLKGTVNSEDEKKAVEEKAAAVAGADNVTNEVMVKTSHDKKPS
jgi:hyperosmotically inducible periplasmic protein